MDHPVEIGNFFERFMPIGSGRMFFYHVVLKRKTMAR